MFLKTKIPIVNVFKTNVYIPCHLNCSYSPFIIVYSSYKYNLATFFPFMKFDDKDISYQLDL